jgi:hypothetical protein
LLRPDCRPLPKRHGSSVLQTRRPAELRRLVKANPSAYQQNVANMLNNLALLHIRMDKSKEATTEIGEAETINWARWKSSPVSATDDLALSHLIHAVA